MNARDWGYTFAALLFCAPAVANEQYTNGADNNDDTPALTIGKCAAL